jgi:hypothetical protein
MRLPTLLIGVMIFLSSCYQQQVKNFDALVFINFSADNTTSFKIYSIDTLFREKKLPFTAEYSYKLLSKSEGEKLNVLVDKLQKWKQPEPSFSIGLNKSVLFIKNDTSNRYYTNQVATKTSNFREISNWFEPYLRDTSFENVTTNFWNIEGIHEPPGPPIPVDSTEIILPLTNGFMQLRREVVSLISGWLFIFCSGGKLSIEQKNLS